ncbi:MAG TPA: DUF5005 domain-containing protein [Deltaproteobacteria bacterium]|nr:DUF5005 domain-containing protein [Deltaproteobacteria bacterium]HOI07250.1 DUF5005 domain-containing protein [Deltaproteobacteria bacterium]
MKEQPAGPRPHEHAPASRTGLRCLVPAVLLPVVLAFILCTCTSLHDVHEAPVLVQAQRWPQAEEAFRRDRHWLGGDGAYSVVLSPDRVLWLFGDSFIGTGTSRNRRDAAIVRNTVAIQTGTDPSAASLSFHWRAREGRPDAFFPSRGEIWRWPGSGILIEGKLLVFFMEISSEQGGLGFAPSGWGAVLVSNPGDDPAAWVVTELDVPANRFGVLVGSACCLVQGGHLYAYGADARDHGAYLVRFRLGDAARGDLRSPEWWTGRGGWLAQDRLTARPEPLFGDAQMEYTVHYEPSLGRYIEVQTAGFVDPCLTLRSAAEPTGAWSPKRGFYCQTGTEGLLVYAGKAHPGLKGGDLVCTMALNTLDEKRLLEDDSLYYPVFVRGTYRRHGK